MALGLCALGCRALLEPPPDYEFVSTDADSGVGGTGGREDAGRPPLCTAGEVSCDGRAFRVCGADGDRWLVTRVCDSAELCVHTGDSPGCERARCGAGDFRCEGARLETCSEGLETWEAVDQCDSPAQCDANAGRCREAPCSSEPPATQCSGATLQTCVGQQGWQDTGATCESPALCDASAGACVARTCAPGMLQCDNALVLRCLADGTGEVVEETCANVAHCQPRAPSTAPLCSEISCSPGRFLCDGATLRGCNANRDWTPDGLDCGTSGRCDAIRGVCTEQPCTEGDTQCSGEHWVQCEGSGESARWVSRAQCDRPSACDPNDGCFPPVCQRGEYSCDGTTLRRCDIEGDGWIEVDHCLTEGLCRAELRRCLRPVCEAGAVRCSAAGELERCTPGREAWTVADDCRVAAQLPVSTTDPGLTALCDLTGPGTCLPTPTCTEGATRCNGAFVERCSTNTWQRETRCASSGLCNDNGTCTPPSCRPGERRCVTVGESPMVVEERGEQALGLQLEECSPDGSGFVLKEACTNEQYCDSVTGQCDICRPNEYVCVGSDRYLCSGDGRELQFERTCPGDCGILPGQVTADCMNPQQ